MNLRDAKLYVGTYKKYNEGSIAGKWLILSDYADKEDFLKACKELHADEDAPEFMFQDFDEMPESLYNESHIDGVFWELLDACADMDEDEQRQFFDWCAYTGHTINRNTDAGELVETWRERFCGDFSDSWEPEKVFAEQLFDDLYLAEVPESVQAYIDYDAFARDIFMGDYVNINGFIYSNN